MFKAITEDAIYEGVRSLREIVKDKYRYAQQYHRYDWLQECPDGGRDPAMMKMLIQIRTYVSSRDLRIQVMNALFGFTNVALFSTKDLWRVEILSFLDWCDVDQHYPQILEAISLNPNLWEDRLDVIPKLTRPEVKEPDVPEEIPVELLNPPPDPLPGLDPGFIPL